MPHATRTMPHFRVAISLAIAFVLTEPRIHANERIRTLGKDTLGETVKVFQVRYPKARCGRITSVEITAQSLADPGNADDIHCCLNDKDSLSEVSRFPILNFDDCAVHAIFLKNRLWNLSYMLDVRSVQIVLAEFEKLYGPPTRQQRDPEDATKLIFVDWMEGMTSLELRLSRLGSEDVSKNSTQPKGEPWLEVVSIDLWDTDLGTARN
jgi:hypothetical protein